MGRAYFQLLRFPAVFTLIADVMMSYLVVRHDLAPLGLFITVLLASGCLYLAGMVLNDAYDAEIDAIERPERPIPAGKIKRSTALKLGWGMLLAGVLLFLAAGSLVNGLHIGGLSVFLSALVWSYDWAGKRTWLAPLMMGGCRAFNAALVMGIAAAAHAPPLAPLGSAAEKWIVLGIAFYIGGVTWFARGEARTPNPLHLFGGTLAMGMGLLLFEFSGLGKIRPAGALTESAGWPMLWLAIAAVILGRCLWAMWKRESRATQRCVRGAIRAILLIDAALVLGLVGPAWSAAIMMLLVPMFVLERWASTT